MPQKYYLSATACRGVLRRAERRGKELPTILKTALEQQIERWEKYGTPLLRFEGVGTRNGKEREFVVIAVDRSAFNQGENAKYNIGIDDNGTAFTVTAKGPGAVCYCLQGNGVDRADTAECNGKGVKENECYTLNTVDRHAVCYGFSPDNSPSCDGVNLNEKLSPTLQVHKKLGICREAVETQYIVRRLTPLECCRLQGMPDWWLDDVEGSDAARYKLWGNGMALPNALYIMEGIAQAEANE